MRRQRFVTWAKKDPDDETPIDYTFRGNDGVHYFNSDCDYCTPSMMERIRNAWVESIKLVNGRWKVVIYEEGY